MKRIYWLLCLCLVASSCAPPRLIVKRYPAPGERLRVAVLPFQDAPGRAGSGKIATSDFSGEILRVTAYNVIDRGALEQVLNEQKLAASGAIDQTKAVEVGKLLGADGIIVGAVTEFVPRFLLMFPPAKVTITARYINVRTGEVEWSASHGVGGVKRWLWWVVPATGVIASLVSPTAEDQVSNASRAISRKVQTELENRGRPGGFL